MKNVFPVIFLIYFYIGSAGQSFTVEETVFKNNELSLAADIFIPDNPSVAKKGIAIIQGSGNSDRDNLWSRSFAQFLAQSGYYVLLPDKRGCGMSEGDWKNASFETLAIDAVLSAKHLKNEMDLESVGVMGLSQGGFIAPIAASGEKEIDFVINIVGASVRLEEQIVHEVSNTALDNGLAPDEIVDVLDLHVLMRNYALTGNWSPLRDRYAELRKSSWAKFAATFPNDPDLWVWEWIKLNINFDPMKYWKLVDQDVFVAYGVKDQSDNIPVFESVYRLEKGFSEREKENFVIGMYPCGHAMYEDEKAVLRQEFLDDLLEWIKSLN